MSLLYPHREHVSILRDCHVSIGAQNGQTQMLTPLRARRGGWCEGWLQSGTSQMPLNPKHRTFKVSFFILDNTFESYIFCEMMCIHVLLQSESKDIVYYHPSLFVDYFSRRLYSTSQTRLSSKNPMPAVQNCLIWFVFNISSHQFENVCMIKGMDELSLQCWSEVITAYSGSKGRFVTCCHFSILSLVWVMSALYSALWSKTHL